MKTFWGLVNFFVSLLLSSQIAAEVLEKSIHRLNPLVDPQQRRPRIFGDEGERATGRRGNRPTPSPTVGSDPTAPIGHAGVDVVGCSTGECGPLVYYGGSIVNTPKLYVMYYGNWNALDQNLVQYYLLNLGGNSPYNVLSSFPFNPPSGNIIWGGSVNRNPANYNKQLSDTDIRNLVMNEPTWANKDLDGIYFVLSSPDVNATSGFCKQYCGFHSIQNVVRYVWVGNAETQCLNACSPGAGPNGRRGADAMISIITHELAEAVTDGYFDGYSTELGYETGDLCGWTYGTTTTIAGVGKYNIQLGDTKFLVQQLVDYRNLGTQVCSLVHSPLPPTPQGSDDCASALPIFPGSQTAQTNYGMAAAASPPMTQACSPVVNDMYYKLTIPSLPAVCTVDTCTGDFDSVVSVFSSCSATQPFACNNDGFGCGSQSNLTFTALQNTYIIGVGNYAGSNLPGTFTLRVSCTGQPTFTLSPSTQSPTQTSSPTVAPPPTLPTPAPTSQPTLQPTSQPSPQPTSQPTSQPTPQPTSQPTRPTRQPTRSPTSRSPTIRPSKPTSRPTKRLLG